MTDPQPLRPGSIEQTLAGHADLRVGAVVREAWGLIDGVKAPLLLGGVMVYGGIFLLLGLLGALAPEALEAVAAREPHAELLVNLLVSAAVYPFMGGVFMFALRRSVGQPVRFEDLFAQYGRLLPIVAVSVLQSLAITLGLLLLILPGLYLAFALSLALPLKVERDLPLMACMATSLRLVNRNFLSVAMLSALSGALILLGFLSLIGWIWTLPWVVLIYGITYRQLAGLRDGAAPPSPPGIGGGRERVKGIVEY